MHRFALCLMLLACRPTPPTAMNDLEGDFFDAPFPNVERTTENGAPDYTGFPNPSASSLIEQYLEVTQTLGGASTVAPITFRFSSGIDEGELPTPTESLSADASVLLIDIDPNSPHFGKLIPTESHWQSSNTSHQAKNLLSIAPIYGIPLRTGTEYAAIVRTDLAQPAPGFPDKVMLAEEDSDWGRIRNALTALGVPADEVAVATRFTTQDPLSEMAQYAWWTRNNLPLPALDQELEYTKYNKFFRLFKGKMEIPLWQSGEKPYSTKGGGFVTDESGDPQVYSWEDISFSLTIPSDMEMPDDGWPVLIYSHGTGGSFKSCCAGESALLPARQLAKRGIATFGISQPLHAERATPGTDENIHTFNYGNPESARHNFRQGALEIIYQAALLAEHDHSFSFEGERFAVNPNKVLLMGHSQGGLTGAIAAPYLGDLIQGVVLSGAGGGMSITLTQRKDFVDIEAVIKELLRFDSDEELTRFHPVSGLIQVLTDITDPLNYARYWHKEEAWFSTKPVSVLLTEGLKDEQTPSETTEALAAAGGLPILEPAAHVSDAHFLLGLDVETLPVSDNQPAWDESWVTVGLAQYAERDHFAVFDSKSAARLVYDFLESTLSESPTLGSDPG